MGLYYENWHHHPTWAITKIMITVPLEKEFKAESISTINIKQLQLGLLRRPRESLLIWRIGIKREHHYNDNYSLGKARASRNRQCAWELYNIRQLQLGRGPHGRNITVCRGRVEVESGIGTIIIIIIYYYHHHLLMLRLGSIRPTQCDLSVPPIQCSLRM